MILMFHQQFQQPMMKWGEVEGEGEGVTYRKNKLPCHIVYSNRPSTVVEDEEVAILGHQSQGLIYMKYIGELPRRPKSIIHVSLFLSIYFHN